MSNISSKQSDQWFITSTSHLFDDLFLNLSGQMSPGSITERNYIQSCRHLSLSLSQVSMYRTIFLPLNRGWTSFILTKRNELERIGERISKDYFLRVLASSKGRDFFFISPFVPRIHWWILWEIFNKKG